MENKRAQLTIFVIVAIVIVVGVVLFFTLRSSSIQTVPQNMKPIYDYYLSCLDKTTGEGVSLLGEQGGYIKTPDFVAGSQYRPFSSQLSFFGQPVPYWMYISGNNILKEQVPTKSSMESQLNDYVKNRLNYCDFSDFQKQGYEISVGSGSVKTTINSLNVDLVIDNPVVISFENKSVTIGEHKISHASKLGKFYDYAVKLYNYEKKSMFLEKYAIDVMRLYAPVDGVEISCAPKIFNKPQISQDIQNALADNIGFLKVKGDYYTLNSKQNQYFVSDPGFSSDEDVNFIYSKSFPTKVEIYGDNVANPVGLQQGLGILGFCYVPYHLVYDINFPVLVQFYDNSQIFQFPITVIIDKSQERTAIPGEASVGVSSDVCQYNNQDVLINTYDSELRPVESSISFKCLNSECRIGETKTAGGDASLNAKVPQCVNGFIIANSEGYAEAKYQISTNEESVANVVLAKIYNLSLELKSSQTMDSAIVNFVSDGYQTAVLYPDTKSVALTEGDYNISIYVYKNSSLQIPAQNNRQCVQVPKSGIGALVGATEEQCFDMNIPAQTIDHAVIGGGKSQYYIAESQLKESKKLNINVLTFKTPSSLADVQDNYNSIDGSNLDLEFT